MKNILIYVYVIYEIIGLEVLRVYVEIVSINF